MNHVCIRAVVQGAPLARLILTPLPATGLSPTIGSDFRAVRRVATCRNDSDMTQSKAPGIRSGHLERGCWARQAWSKVMFSTCESRPGPLHHLANWIATAA